MKLIDAEKLLEKAWDADTRIGYVQVVDVGDILEAPGIELVRCRDCKWYEIYQLKKDGTDDRRYKPSYCTLLRHSFKPDWYCADGERRREE